MAAKILSIELGERLIKVCERGAKTHVYKHFSFLTPEGLVNDGQITDPAALGAALKAELSKNGLGGRKKAVFVLRSGKVASREVKLPPVRENRLKGLVETNASEYFPVDMSKYHISYTVLERKDKGSDAFCRLQVLAVPLALLEGYFTMAEAAGLQAETVDYAGSCMYRRLTELPQAGVTMYVDVGCTASDVTILDGKKLMLQRSFPVGGDELVFAQMGADGSGDGEYIETLENLCRGSTTLPSEIVSDSLNRLTGNILRIADYFNSNNWETPVEKLVLLGDCAAIVNLRQQVEESVTYPVEILTELAGYTAGAKATPLSSAFLACAGCPLQRTDFVPEAMGRKTKKAKKPSSETISLGVIVCAGCVLIGAAMAVSSFLDYQDALNEQQQVKDEITQLEPARTLYNTYVDYTAAAEGFQTVYSDAEKPNAHLLDFIGELEEKMPSQISVLSAVCSNDGVSMNIIVPSKDAAALVIVQLRSFESLADVSVGAISETEGDSGIIQVSFAVNCLYGENPYLADGSAN
ncbi:MAG: pilus assembly protein PilM [Clostridiaceae bacterium]|nr:pilus assembly protein PilM [Clostridiaceae bacterium]